MNRDWYLARVHHGSKVFFYFAFPRWVISTELHWKLYFLMFMFSNVRFQVFYFDCPWNIYFIFHMLLVIPCRFFLDTPEQYLQRLKLTKVKTTLSRNNLNNKKMITLTQNPQFQIACIQRWKELLMNVLQTHQLKFSWLCISSERIYLGASYKF